MPAIDDPELEGLVIRAQEMGRYVENDILDMGITGLDWVLEQNSKVVEVARLRYGKVGFRGVKWVVAVPIDSPIKDLSGTAGKEDRDRACGLHHALSEVAEDRCHRGVFMGGNRGQAAPARGRHRRGDGDGRVARGEQPAHHRDHPRIGDRGDREQGRLQGQVEEDEDREYRDAPQGGPPRRREGGAQDERAEGKAR